MERMERPDLVLLDAGGVFILPDPERVLAAFARAECRVDPDVLADAHYRGVTELPPDLDVEADWADCWRRYLARYVAECGVAEGDREEAHRHVDSEFADAGLWTEVIGGSREGLAALAATGVKLGIVSNADGIMGARLAELDVCQVGPGPSVSVSCVIDSGAVGIMKPDPRIFQAALDVIGVPADRTWYVGDMPAIDVVGARRAGIHAVLIDPLGLHLDADYDRTASLAELADRIADLP